MATYPILRVAVDDKASGRDGSPVVDWSQLAVDTASLPDTLSSMIERLLLEGELPAGARLPTERQLAAQLGVSRASVREAIHELRLKGLVERRPGRGTVVLNADGASRGDLLLGMMAPDSRDLRSILDFREAIEPPITSRAALRATPSDLGSLRAVVADMERASPAAYGGLDRHFHLLVARTTHNPLLERLADVTAEWMASIRRDSLQSPQRRTASMSGHRAILDAIVRHDAEAAAAATLAHVRSVGSILTDSAPATSMPDRVDDPRAGASPPDVPPPRLDRG